MNPIYRFILTVNGQSHRAYPIYGSDLAKQWNQQSGEKFFRESLSGVLVFCGPDYYSIIARPFGEKFGLLIEISSDGGSTWSAYWTGEFTLTDCKVNEDEHTISVTPTPVDKYTTLLEGIEKEFDIVKLTPAISQVKVDKRPILQVYRAGAGVIGCYLAGMWWEQECERVSNHDTLINDFFFARTRRVTCVDLNFMSAQPPLIPDQSAIISADSDGSANFTITGSGFTYQQIATQGTNAVTYELYVYQGSDTTKGWYYREVVMDPQAVRLEGTYTLQSFGGAPGFYEVTINDLSIYARILTDASTYDDVQAHRLPYNDMASAWQIFRNAVRYNIPSTIGVVTAKTTIPNEWGLYRTKVYPTLEPVPDLVQYYVSPVGALFGGEAFPIARSSWDVASIWFIPLPVPVDTYGVTQFAMRSTYSLSAVINALLSQIDPTITFAEDSLHSLFFYGSPGVVDPYFSYRLFLTPKSNALGMGYDIPAQKGTLSLRQLFDMLRDCFRCYWYIDGAHNLRIEHTKFFDNGLSYTAAQVGANLTTLTVLRNSKAWGWNTSKYSFNKPSLPARYQFSWMDGVTRPFNGQPIDILSPYVQRDSIEEIQSPLFTTDVDYMRSNPSGCSKDGWALLCGEAHSDGGYKVPYYVTELSDVEYNLQNGPLSFTYLQRYYLYDLPARNYQIGTDVRTALGVKKPKTQDVIYPAQNDPDPMRLVKTPLGDGTVQKMSVNLSSRIVNVTLNYAAE